MITVGAAGITILRQGYWENSHICGQLTEIRYRGHLCYVCENYRYDSFGLTSNQRLSFKMG